MVRYEDNSELIFLTTNEPNLALSPQLKATIIYIRGGVLLIFQILTFFKRLIIV
jgi:hypothetical protein